MRIFSMGKHNTARGRRDLFDSCMGGLACVMVDLTEYRREFWADPDAESRLRGLQDARGWMGSGLNGNIQDHFRGDEKVLKLLRVVKAHLQELLKVHENTPLVVGVACTWGKHRSVSFAELLGDSQTEAPPPMYPQQRSNSLVELCSDGRLLPLFWFVSCVWRRRRSWRTCSR